ncbi:hypothetical protein F383_30807 [Gossypium arboreum]|uniref:Uncharacterized protein n=1 Tax=Gossypium arboreum TaxID=29729 RepID=A0A0B0N1F1_GOSAR|nr:hypothetical protein F383_30807 [Gossypium arboreum]
MIQDFGMVGKSGKLGQSLFRCFRL